MRWKFLLCCAFLLWAAAGDAAVAPSIQTVDFYPSGARFTFQAKVNKDFEFTLPGAFDPRSVRLLTQDGVASLRVESLSREEWTPPSLASIKSQVDVKSRELKLLQGRKAAMEQTIEMINAPLTKDFSGKDLILYIEDAQAMRVRVEAELVDMNLSVEKTAKELAALQNEYERKLPYGSTAGVRISGTATTSQPLQFEAFTPAAGWFVRYDMNLNSATGDIDAKMNARAWQRTGLDFAGEFTFHTRQPSFSITPPEIGPLVVGLAQKNMQDVLYAPAPAADMAVGQALMKNDSKAIAPRESLPVMVSTLADVSIKGTGDLKGDGTPEDIALGRIGLKSTPVLVSIPGQSREAWIIASMDAIPAKLLPGYAELAVDGVMTGHSNIPDYGIEQMTLPFGMASRLTAKKERFVGKTGSSWLGKGTVEDGYTLEVTSGMDAEREVTVRDRIPVPSNEKIVLEVKKIEPVPTERDKDNKLMWKMNLKPGETKKIIVEYTLKYPSDETLEYR